MEEFKHSEESILKAVNSYFQNGYSFQIKNAFIFANDWESDFFCTNRIGYSFEVEAKITKADFKADIHKRKHQIFETGGYKKYWKTYDYSINEYLQQEKFVEVKVIPNKFYYAVPEGLISVEEIPDYAGLIYCTSHAKIIKKAPFIHKRKYDFRNKLCTKFYFRYKDLKRENNLLKRTNNSLNEQLKKFEK